MFLTPIKTNNNLVIHYLINNKMKICPICNTIFYTNRSNKIYCKKRCSDIYYIRIRSYSHICKYCNKEFKNKAPKTYYCSSECRGLDAKTLIKCSCTVCNEEFLKPVSSIKNGSDKYCSKKCYSKSMVTKTTKFCNFCGKSFIVIPSSLEKGGGNCCSMKCFFKSMETFIIKECEVCKKQFKVTSHKLKKGWGRFCSRKCSSKNKSMENTKTVYCEVCNKEMTYPLSRINENKNYYCSNECQAINTTGEKSVRWKGGTTQKRVADEHKNKWKKIRKEIYKRDNYKCQHCGVKMGKGKHPHAVHHIVSFNQGSMRYDPINLLLLCERCHMGFVHTKKNVNKLYLASVINLEEGE